MESRKLVLKRERLVELTTNELGQIVAGTHLGCVTHGYSCDDCSVPTLPLNTCLSCNICIDTIA